MAGITHRQGFDFDSWVLALDPESRARFERFLELAAEGALDWRAGADPEPVISPTAQRQELGRLSSTYTRPIRASTTVPR